MATIEEKIWVISEAYSMQPYRYVVGEPFNPTNKGVYDRQLSVIDKIIIETENFQSSNNTIETKEFVVGYDKNFNRLFKFHLNSVNIYYLQEGQNHESN